MYIHLAVPIQKPSELADYIHKPLEPFIFDQDSRFMVYRKNHDNYYLVCDDQEKWYYFTSFTGQDFNFIKYARQIYRPAYLSKEQVLPLIIELKEKRFLPIKDRFDKAFAHTSIFVKSLDELSLAEQLKLANVDGNDDPQVLSTIHYIENNYQGLRTRFISGFETKSFATVSENLYYFENIHLQNVSWTYLQYFIYFEQYKIIPSEQMMARLLGNLWTSTKMMESDWNSSLLKIESTNQPKD